MAAGGVRKRRAVGEEVVCHAPVEPTYCRYRPPWTYGVIAEVDGVNEEGDTVYIVRPAPDARRRLQCLAPAERGG
jgi:hypothetical protein